MDRKQSNSEIDRDICIQTVIFCGLARIYQNTVEPIGDWATWMWIGMIEISTLIILMEHKNCE